MNTMQGPNLGSLACLVDNDTLSVTLSVADVATAAWQGQNAGVRLQCRGNS